MRFQAQWLKFRQTEVFWDVLQVSNSWYICKSHSHEKWMQLQDMDAREWLSNACLHTYSALNSYPHLPFFLLCVYAKLFTIMWTFLVTSVGYTSINKLRCFLYLLRNILLYCLTLFFRQKYNCASIFVSLSQNNCFNNYNCI